MLFRASLTALLLLATAGTAFAVDHEMRISEVMLSNQGTTTSQFIELQDPGESFPNPPYTLHVYAADGTTSLGTVALTIPSGTTRMLVASATAATQFSVTPSATLDFTLPTNGQACFDKSAAHIFCLAWGTVTSQVVGIYGNTLVVSPADGMSIQLVGVGIYNIGTPSPGAANTAPVPDGSPVLPDAAVPPDAPLPPDDGAIPGDASPGGNGNNPKDSDDGCSVGAGASWFGLVALFALIAIGRARRSDG